MYHHSALQGIRQGNLLSGIEKIAKNNDLSKIKKIPRKRAVLAGCFEPGSTRWGPYWSFRRFVQADATHRSKEGSPFFKCWLKNVLPITNTAGALFFLQYTICELFSSLSSMRSSGCPLPSPTTPHRGNVGPAKELPITNTAGTSKAFGQYG